MKVILKNEEWIVNDKNILETELFGKIDSIIEGTNLLFSHMEIDGNLVFESLLDYIHDRFEHIEQIKVVVLTTKEYMDDLLLDANKYIQRAIPQITELTDQLYKAKVDDIWSKIEQLTEGIEWLIHFTAKFNEINVHYSNESKYFEVRNKLISVLPTMLEAVEQTDIILLADILTYEIVPLFKEFQSVINITIDNEVVRNDLN